MRTLSVLLLKIIVSASAVTGLSAQQAEVPQVAEVTQITGSDAGSGEKINRLSEILNNYYSESAAGKKVPSEQNVPFAGGNTLRFNDEISDNDRRLIIKEFFSTPQQNAALGEKPGLFEAHAALARLYAENGDVRHSVQHALQAMKYRTLKFSESVYEDTERLESADLTDEQRNRIETYKNLKQQKKDEEERLRTLERREAVIRDNIETARQRRLNARFKGDSRALERSSNDLADFRSEERNNRDSLQQSRNRLQQIENRLNETRRAVAEDQKNYNRRSAEFMMTLARIFKELETDIKTSAAEKFSEARSAGAPIPRFGYHTSPERNFAAYAQFLRFATLLDPGNARAHFLLGHENRSSGYNARAISAFKGAAEALEKSPDALNPEEKLDLFYTLGSLYRRENDEVHGIWYYEKALEVVNNSNLESYRPVIENALGRLHASKSGNYRRAVELLSAVLERLENSRPDNPFDRVKNLGAIIRTSRYLAHSYEKLRYPSLQAQNLQKSIEAYRNLLSEIENRETVLKEEEQRLNRLKSALREDVPADEYNNYLNQKQTVRREKQLISRLESERRSLPMPVIYFSYARYMQQRDNIDAAIELYTEAEKNGIYPDKARRFRMQLLNN